MNTPGCIPNMVYYFIFLLLLNLSLGARNSVFTNGFNLPGPLGIIQRDFQALTRRVTAYHILLPKSDEVALTLKQSIRNKSSPKKKSEEREPIFVADAFSQAAKKYSRCEDTAENGGLLGKLVPQGYCLAPELDRACFEVPLGEIAGPIESDYGYHLLLVEERLNCPKLDGAYTKIVRGGNDGNQIEFRGKDKDDENLALFVMQQLGFWIGISFAGGIVAEIAVKAAGVFETLPWEQQ